MHMNLKCDPEEPMMLRDPFKAVIPGWHMNKELWNTLVLDDSVPRGDIKRMIDVSCGLVIDKLSN